MYLIHVVTTHTTVLCHTLTHSTLHELQHCVRPRSTPLCLSVVTIGAVVDLWLKNHTTSPGPSGQNRTATFCGYASWQEMLLIICPCILEKCRGIRIYFTLDFTSLVLNLKMKTSLLSLPAFIPFCASIGWGSVSKVMSTNANAMLDPT